MRVVAEPSAAPTLASTIDQDAFNLGSAVGAWLGGARRALRRSPPTPTRE